MQRYFVDSVEGELVSLRPEDARHLRVVLRARAGERVILCDGRGAEAVCELAPADGAEACVRVLERRESLGEPSVAIHLYPSLAKGERFEWLLQKTVELGAASITPVISERCVATAADDKKLARWRRIVREAAEQSGRGIIPPVHAAASFREAVLRAEGSRLLCFEEERETLLGEQLRRSGARVVSVFTGPEGGYGAGESAFARENGCAAVSLGRRILRCETAPVAAVCAVLSSAGEL